MVLSSLFDKKKMSSFVSFAETPDQKHQVLPLLPATKEVLITARCQVWELGDWDADL